MFGKKKGSGRTVLLLDIESGSVGTALLRIDEGKNPFFLSYQRQHLPLAPTLNSGNLTSALEHTLKHSLSYITEVAARMRVNAKAEDFGTIDHAAVFLAAPWGVPNLSLRKPEYVQGIREYIKTQVAAAVGDVPVYFYTSADSVAHGSRAVGKHQNTMTLSLRGELLEMLLLNEEGPQGYSTVPLGSRSVLRTLQTHGSLTEHEARSRLALTQHDDSSYEPLLVAGRNLTQSFAEGAELLLPSGTAASVVVFAEPPLGDWFAKSIAEDGRLSVLFAEDATVEALRPHHVAGVLEAGNVTDPFMLMEALFVNLI